MFNETYYQELSSEMIQLWGGENYVLKRNAITCVTKVTSALSFFGSVYILFDILKTRNSSHHLQLSNLFNQLLFCLSCSDAISSLAMFFSTWAMPADGIDAKFFAGSSGSATSCTTQGIVLVIGLVSANTFVMFISIEHLLVFRYDISLSLLKKIHRVFILLAPFISLTFAISFLVDDAVVPLGLYCAPGAVYPYFCRYAEPSREDECIIIEPQVPGAQITFLIYFFICLLSVFICMILIIAHTKSPHQTRSFVTHAVQNDPLSIRVMRRASQYIAASSCMYLMLIINIILPKTWKTGFFLSATYPLHGFLNALIYSGKFESFQKMCCVKRTINSFEWISNQDVKDDIQDDTFSKAFKQIKEVGQDTANSRDFENSEGEEKVSEDTTSFQMTLFR